ncbi:unnamed protein product [Peniophora sp. CBMAI 1063]|nr:unnamed protein product [Peniophora sp. CBMAI 1063]
MIPQPASSLFAPPPTLPTNYGQPRQAHPNAPHLKTPLTQAQTLESQRKDLLIQVNALRLERADLLYKLSIANGYLNSAQRQLSTFHVQCNMLAGEARERRLRYIREICPDVGFFDSERMQVRVANVSESMLPRFKTSVRNYAVKRGDLETPVPIAVVFAHRPPSSLPLCIKQIASHGYWFAPIGLPSPGQVFELLVECSPERWMCIGRYEHFALSQAYGMSLSEWAGLDEDVRVPPHSYRTFADKFVDIDEESPGFTYAF